ncbi:MAG: nitrous oxide reductase family maturation protein NosD [Verrucomicrobiia bacterium]
MFPTARIWRRAAFLTAFLAFTAQAFSPSSIWLDVESQEVGVLVRVHSAPGELNRLEVSDDLLVWKVAGVMFNSTGIVEYFSEPQFAGAQFYRATTALPEPQLSVLSAWPTVSESRTEFIPISENGGLVSGNAAVAEFRAGEVIGAVRAALVTGPAVLPAISPVWDARVRQLGPSYSLVIRGDGVVRGGRLQLSYDPVQVPEGWEPRVLMTSALARAVPLVTSLPTTGPQLVTPQTLTAEEETRLAQEREKVLADGPGVEDPPVALAQEFRSFVCAHSTSPGRIDAPILAGDAPGLTELYQLVLTRKAENQHLHDTPGRQIACVFFLVEPPHGKAEYLGRLETALRGAISLGRRLGIPEPPFPISITITDELRSGPPGSPRQHAGLTSGTRMALRNDLMAQWPLGDTGHLEYTVAHEYFHVLTAFATSLSTYGEPKNEWALEGAAEWFALKLYDNFDEKWIAPMRGLEGASYDAAPFWMYLEARFGSRIVTETLDFLRWAALGPRRFDDLSLRIAFGLRQEIHYVTEALDRVLRRRDTSLSEVFGDFAASYLYLRDFAQGDQGNGEHPGIWHGLDPYEFPTENKAIWSEVSLLTTTTNYPIVLDHLTIPELSATALRFTEKFDRGRFHLRIENPSVSLEALEPSSCRELGPPQLRLTLLVEKAGRAPEFLDTFLVGTNGIDIQLDNVGHRGRFDSVVALLANVGWRTRRDCPGSSERLETGIGTMRYRLKAYLDERRSPRGPQTTHVSIPAGGKRWCVSKDRSEDEDGNRCFGTFAAAISNNDVEDYSELVVDPGIYEEHVAITKSLFIRPKIAGTVAIKAPGTVVSFAKKDAWLANFILVGGGNVVPVINGTPDGHGAVVTGNVIISRGPGISFYDSSGHSIVKNWIAARQGGINISYATGSVISGNIIAPPFIREDLEEPVITGDRIETPPSYQGVIDSAISLFRCSNATVSENESITWDWLGTTSFDAGLQANSVNGLTVESNIFRAPYGDGFFSDNCTSVSATGNRFVGFDGIRVNGSRDVSLRRNTVQGSMNGVIVSDSASLSTATNLFIPGGTSWSFTASQLRGLTSQGDVFDGSTGGGATFVQSGGLMFDGAQFRGWDTACELWDVTNAVFLNVTFEHAAPQNDASKPGDAGGLLGRRADQVIVRDSTFLGRNVAVDLEEGFHPVWENLRITGSGVGIVARKINLSVKDVTFQPGIDYPFVAAEGSLTLENVRFSHLDAQPIVYMPAMEMRNGTLELIPLSKESAFPFTSLAPWWFEVSAAGGDYRLEYLIDLRRMRLPAPPKFEEMGLPSIFWAEPEYFPARSDTDTGLVSLIAPRIEYGGGNQRSTARYGVVVRPLDAAYP